MTPVDTHNLADAKSRLRRAVLAARDAMSVSTRAAASQQSLAVFFARPEFDAAKNILSYMSFGTEIDTHPVFDEVLRRGKTLLLPRIRRDVADQTGTSTLTLHRVTSRAELVAGVWGIAEPAADCPTVQLGDVAFALVPGVAFDSEGNRLGYGKGYYDRLLAGRSTDKAANLIGSIAFECQLVEHVPVGTCDQPINLLITPIHEIFINP